MMLNTGAIMAGGGNLFHWSKCEVMLQPSKGLVPIRALSAESVTTSPCWELKIKMIGFIRSFLCFQPLNISRGKLL